MDLHIFKQVTRMVLWDYKVGILATHFGESALIQNTKQDIKISSHTPSSRNRLQPSGQFQGLPDTRPSLNLRYEVKLISEFRKFNLRRMLLR